MIRQTTVLAWAGSLENGCLSATLTTSSERISSRMPFTLISPSSVLAGLAPGCDCACVSDAGTGVVDCAAAASQGLAASKAEAANNAQYLFISVLLADNPVVNGVWSLPAPGWPVCPEFSGKEYLSRHCAARFRPRRCADSRPAARPALR